MTEPDSTRSAMVDHNYHWRPIDASTPRGVKLQLINSHAGTATYGRLATDAGFWTHWAPLPTFSHDDYLPEQCVGIIDPDYARIFTQARIVAWQHGYACLAHGSFSRDLDLLLVPWTDRSGGATIEHVIKHLATATGTTVNGPPAKKPHGRKAWTLLLSTGPDPRWVDLSVFTPIQDNTL